MKLTNAVFRNRSLGYKFMLLSVVPIIFATTFIVLNIVNSIEKSMIDEIETKVMELTRLTALSMSNAFVFYNKNLLDNFVDNLVKEKNIRTAMIVDANDNRILAHNDHENDGKLLDEAMQNNAVNDGGTKTRELSDSITIEGQKFGTVRVEFSHELIDKEISEIKNRILMVAAIAVLLSTLLSFLLARIITKPIKALSEQAKRAGEGDFNQKIDYSSKDALGRLADAFNKMVSDIKEKQHQLETEINRRRQTEELQRRYNFIVNASKDLNSLINRDYTYEAVNDAYSLSLNLKRQEIVGQTVADIWGTTVFQDIIEGYVDRCFAGEEVNYQTWLDLPVLGSQYFNVTYYPYRNPEDKITHAVVVSHNITKQKQAEIELQKAHDGLEKKVTERTAALENAMEKAQEADRLKSAFLAAMSHELRTPLNSIIGFTGIILQGLVGPLNQEQTKQLGMVRTSAHHLLGLINDVLDISKIEAGQLEIDTETFDMRDAVDKVIGTVAPLAEKKELPLTAQVSMEVGKIDSDRRRVEQILINLINNAIKFTEKGQVRVECRIREQWLETSVTDSGIGIKTEDVGRLFQAFQQIDSGLTRRYEGTGLGLSICKKLIELLGGRIWVESEWEVGSTFAFALPLR